MNFKLEDNLLKDFYEFLKFDSSFNDLEISNLISLLEKYRNASFGKEEKKILSLIENIVLEDYKNQGELFTLENKYAANSISVNPFLIDKHPWLIRSVISRLKVFKRQEFMSNNKSHVNQINKNGILIIKDFCNSDLYSFLKNEYINKPVALNKNSTKTVARNLISFKRINLSIYREKYSGILLDEIIRKVFSLGFNDDFSQTKRIIRKSTFWQILNILYKDHDIQKDCHMDTFFPSLKFWYFPLRVSSKKSFMYAKYSNRLTFKRMQIDSLKLKKMMDLVPNEVLESRYSLDLKSSSSYESSLQGSFRYSLQEMEEMGLELKPITVPANSLIIADVSGMHSRGLGSKNFNLSLRIAMHGNSRHLNVF